MGKKTSSSAAAKTSAAKTSVPAVAVTPVRNTSVPPKSAVVAAPAKKLAPAYDTIATRAYYIWKSTGGGQFDNWIRAERELSAI